jgi:hypothetical protein
MKKWINHITIFLSIAMLNVGLVGAGFVGAGLCSQESCHCVDSHPMPPHEKQQVNPPKTCCCKMASHPCNIQPNASPTSVLRTGTYTHVTQNPLSVVFPSLSVPPTKNALNQPTFGGQEELQQIQATPLYLAHLSFLI